MEALHLLIKNRQWDQVQHALKLDASIAMRVDDSIEEDNWVDEARRLWLSRRKTGKTAEQQADEEAELKHLFAQIKVSRNEEIGDSNSNNTPPPPMQLRYWTSNNSAAYKLRRLTLLHSICRLDFSSSSDGDDNNESGSILDEEDLMMAIQTAEMIISASHNELQQQQRCNVQCPCHYCPPMHCRYDEDDGENEGSSATKEEVVLHKSALTMTDKMGDTPLHLLTCAGSNLELIKALFRGCVVDTTLTVNAGCQRPTIYNLLTAPNDHGCTSLHHISECNRTKDEDVLRYVLAQCPLSSSNFDHERVHPSMVGDNEGVIPLHYATSNCAPPSCLRLLTKLGDKRSALVTDSHHKLPVDLLIEWYLDNLDEQSSNEESDDSSDNESEDDSGSDDSDDSDSVGSQKQADLVVDNSSDNLADSAAREDEQVGDDIESRPVEDIVRGLSFLSQKNIAYRGFFPTDLPGRSYLTPGGVGFSLVLKGISSGSYDFWESDLWKQMIVLVDAAASATLSANGIGEVESEPSNLQPNPVHAAVIATKYGNFPALALTTATPLDRNLRNEMTASYFLGYLPLHWACGDIGYLLNTESSRQTRLPMQRKPIPSEHYPEIVRFNTRAFEVTMIQYLLLLYPEAARIPTSHGELPLHLFLQDGRALYRHVCRENFAREYVEEVPFDPLRSMLRWSLARDKPRRTPYDEIKSLLTACPEAVATPSVTNHLYPYQLAATASHSFVSGGEYADEDMQKKTRLISLENTYRLILEDPTVI